MFTTYEWKNAWFNSCSSCRNWNSFELQTSIIRTSQYSKHKNGKITVHLHVNEKSAWIAFTGRCTRTLALALTKTAQTSSNQLFLQLRLVEGSGNCLVKVDVHILYIVMYQFLVQSPSISFCSSLLNLKFG